MDEEIEALKILEVLDENNIGYCINPSSGDIYFANAEQKEKGEKLIKEVENKYSVK
jgi:hypothetical protein